MAILVYSLCAVTSLVCAGLLLRSYLRNRTQLLFWSSLCFLGLAVNNILLFIDLVLVPALDLSMYRALSALLAMALLLFGLIWKESE
ncbi:MAG TPA: DUF5985 family protein [Pyrinomonadaceae bacterium]|nr:DUF5985 family protein [Pyrinomonadaceae bacterium]